MRVRRGFLTEEHPLVANRKHMQVGLAAGGALQPIGISDKACADERTVFTVHLGGTTEDKVFRPLNNFKRTKGFFVLYFTKKF